MKNFLILPFFITALVFMPALASADILKAVKMAENGDLQAQLVLAYMYDMGVDVTENKQEAAKWYRLAAQQGDSKAQLTLGYKYDLGDGVEQDYNKAKEWYIKAAYQGEVKAQETLGGMYTFGEGVPVDYVEGYAWFNVAASGGSEDAKNDRDFIAHKMTPTQIEKAQDISREIFNKINNRTHE